MKWRTNHTGEKGILSCFGCVVTIVLQDLSAEYFLFGWPLFSWGFYYIRVYFVYLAKIARVQNSSVSHDVGTDLAFDILTVSCPGFNLTS